jgi:hypothetical protein
MAICLSLLLLTLIASACSQQVTDSSNTTSTKTVNATPKQSNKGKITPVVNSTSTTVAASNVTQFVGDSFSVNVPKGWNQRHSQTNYAFSEANGVTAFFVGVHKSNQKLGNDLINKITMDGPESPVHCKAGMNGRSFWEGRGALDNA